MSDHSLSNVARSCGATTWAMILKQAPCCRKKNLHNQNISFLSETKDMLQKSFETRPRLQKKKPSPPNIFSFFLKLVLPCINLLKQDPYCKKMTHHAGVPYGQRGCLIRINLTATQAADTHTRISRLKVSFSLSFSVSFYVSSLFIFLKNSCFKNCFKP